MKTKAVHFAALLQAKRESVLANRRSVHLETGEEGPTAFSFHAADHAGAAYDREVGARVLETETDLLTEIDAALARITSDAYGRCETCEAAIAPERLEAKPWARHCVPCQSKVEKNGQKNGRRR